MNPEADSLKFLSQARQRVGLVPVTMVTEYV